MRDLLGAGASDGAEVLARKYGKCVIVSDFDGTITTRDTNVAVIKEFGSSVNDTIRAEYNAGRIGLREALPIHYREVHITEEEYFDYIVSNIEIDPGFSAFRTKIMQAQVPLIIVSGGNLSAIKQTFAKYSMETPQVYANEIHFHGREIQLEFLHEQVNCAKSYGPCGNCKLRFLEEYKEQYDNIIFIGDGLTDRCAAEKADVIFAKHKLAQFCQEQGIHYIAYEDFHDVALELFSE